ncbi:hypothetical protein L1D58_20130, partial [Vibrio diabolicus]|uniref:hypothetical protein n=1 Tax=Vibrio diabolicus TaxID=50719 RepID=UPI00211B5ED8
TLDCVTEPAEFCWLIFAEVRTIRSVYYRKEQAFCRRVLSYETTFIKDLSTYHQLHLKFV